MNPSFRQIYLPIFLLCMLIRGLFLWLTGFNHYELQSDSVWIERLSEQVLQGNFDFDIGRFIASPLYQCIIAFFKLIFGTFWDEMLTLTQVGMSSLAGVYLFRLAGLLFENNAKISWLTAVLYAFFPMTLWWVGTFSTETFFQSGLIISVFYLVKSVLKNNYRSLLISAIFYGFTFLHKSHILLFSPFIVLFIFLKLPQNWSKKLQYAISYAVISLLFTLPSGIYNYTQHDTYVLSSNGAKYQLFLGNTEIAYRTIVDVPTQNSEAYFKLKNINADASYFVGEVYDSIMLLPQAIKQDLFWQEAKKWIRMNPIKCLELKTYDFVFFIIPGVSWRHYPFKKWLLSFIFSFPIYLLAYYGIFHALRTDFRRHAWLFGLLMNMLLFSVLFYVQNRFRTITLEPFYLMYAASSIALFWDHWKKRNSVSNKNL